MGDDLIAARDAVTAMRERLDGLMCRADSNTDHNLDGLEYIRARALDIQAGAVARACRFAMDSAGTGTASFHRSLVSVSRVLAQYTDGLDELAPVAFEAPAEPQREPMTAAPETQSDAQPDVSHVPVLAITERQAFLKAKETLESVIRFAPADDRAALMKLSRFDVFGEASAPAKQAFDAMMPEITEETLRAARLSGKSISLSYAADDAELDGEVYNTLETALTEVCTLIVRHSLETPQNREQSGRSRAGHMALTARKQGRELDILVTCDGVNVPDHTDIAMTALGKAQLRRTWENGLLKVEISGVPLAGTETVRTDAEGESLVERRA